MTTREKIIGGIVIAIIIVGLIAFNCTYGGCA